MPTPPALRNETTGSGTATTAPLTLSVVAGDLIIMTAVPIHVAATSGAAGTCVDTAGNSYTNQVSVAANGGGTPEAVLNVWTAIANSTATVTITVTWAGGVTPTLDYVARAECWSNIASGTPDVKCSGGDGRSTTGTRTQSCNTPTTTVTDALVWSAPVYYCDDSSITPTYGSLYTSLGAVTALRLGLFAQYYTLASAPLGHQNASGTAGTDAPNHVINAAICVIVFPASVTNPISKAGGAYSDLDGAGTATLATALSGGAYSNLDGSGSDTVARTAAGGAYSNLDGAGTETRARAASGGAYSNLDAGGDVTRPGSVSGGAYTNLDAGGSIFDAEFAAGGAYSDLDGGGTETRARAAAGGARSNLDAGGTVSEFLPPDPPVAACAARGLTSVGITWTDTPGTNPISHYEARVDGAAPIVVAGLAYTFTGLASGTCFDFTVRGVDNLGTAGAWSNPARCCTTIASISGVSLGCGLYTVYVLERGGGAIVAELPFTGLSWTRMLDDTSSCTVMIDGLSGAEGAKCCATLRGVTPWEHEIGVYRNGERVWAGPYVSAQLRSTGAELDARDLSIWPFRRIIHHDHAFVNTDLADIFAAYVLDAMSVDNSPGLVVTPTATGIRGKRTVLASMAKLVGPLLKELDRTGIDWTVIDRAMMVGGTSIATPSIGMLTDSHFAVEPDVYLDGLSQATDVYTRGAGGGAKGAPILGHAFDTAARAKYGWLEIAPRERLIEDDTSALVSADSRLQLIRDTPAFISQARLSPEAPVEMRSLVPGAVCDVRLTYTCWPVVGLQRLHDVTVTLGKDSAETVDVTFQPIGTNEEPTS